MLSVYKEPLKYYISNVDGTAVAIYHYLCTDVIKGGIDPPEHL